MTRAAPGYDNEPITHRLVPAQTAVLEAWMLHDELQLSKAVEFPALCKRRGALAAQSLFVSERLDRINQSRAPRRQRTGRERNRDERH